MCDAPHICRRAGGLGFNSQEVLWETSPASARLRRLSGTIEQNRERTSHAAHPTFPIDRPDLKPIIAARISLRKDRKSTRLNSSHSQISYAVFCLKKKTNT